MTEPEGFCTAKQSIEQYQQRWRRIKFNIPSIDRTIGGGIPERGIVEFSGDPGSGKTQLMLHLALTAQLQYACEQTRKGVVYISTEHPFASQRLIQMERALNLAQADVRLSDHIFVEHLTNSVVFGTKCNKLMVYDVNTRKVDAIPTLPNSRGASPDTQSGIHACQINPSHSLLATGARHSADIAIYRLPTLDPLCIGENAHRDWVFDMCWLDDQFLVSGSRDTKLALWRINEDTMEFPEAKEGEEQDAVPLYAHINSISVKDCRGAQKIRAICFNKEYRELALLSLNGYMHLFNAETFSQKLSRKLPNCQENVCIACQPNGLYAVGCRSYTLLLDPRTLQAVKKIASRYSGCGIRSASFQGNILTIGTGLGMLMFYDIRAGKYLESQTSASRTVVLKASRGYVAQFPEEEMDNFQQIKYVPAIYTHCYDSSGTRLFTAGGPLPATLIGNYAGIWQ